MGDQLKTQIFDTLRKLNLTSLETRKIYNKETRDMNNLTVWRDEVSGVIYIDKFYTGDHTYTNGAYRDGEYSSTEATFADVEASMDANRRFKDNLRVVADKKIIDFGCGNGDFLRLVAPYCDTVQGVELQQSIVNTLNSEGISCVNDLAEIEDSSVDICVSFHVIEHLPNPLETLAEIKRKIRIGGSLLIEVPHANDFLLSTIPTDCFKQFTLWSQHLILHTRDSLRRMLHFSGFEQISIAGVQRYPLSNHLNWLANSEPGGHKSMLSMIDTQALTKAYESSLALIDATDTLVATCKVSR